MADRLVYLASAHASPLPLVAADAVAADARDVAHRGALALDDRFARLAPLRAQAADLLGVGGDDVALVANTTHGLGLVFAVRPSKVLAFAKHPYGQTRYNLTAATPSDPPNVAG